MTLYEYKFSKFTFKFYKWVNNILPLSERNYNVLLSINSVHQETEINNNACAGNNPSAAISIHYGCKLQFPYSFHIAFQISH